jgi:hypothetical protein
MKHKCDAMSDAAPQRAQKSSRRKKFQRNFFSIEIFFNSNCKRLTGARRARFYLPEDVITFSGLIHPHLTTKVRLSNVQINKQAQPLGCIRGVMR